MNQSPTVKNDLIDTYFADVRKRFPRRQYVLKGINDLMQCDLLDVGKYAEFNDGHNMILTAINCFTKFAYARPLKGKTAQEVTAAMASILEGVYPMVRNVQVDKGTEFYNKHFKALMSKYNINMYSVHTEIKASMIERFHRTFRRILVKETYKRNSPKWVDFLQDLVWIYNNTKHSTTKLKPVDVSFSNENLIRVRLNSVNRNYKREKIRSKRNRRGRSGRKKHKTKFKVGDFVHISKQKHVFEKGTFNYTPLVFQVRKVEENDIPTTYRLRDTEGRKQDIIGTFYAEELKLAKHGDAYVVQEVLKEKKIRGRPHILVKFLGFDDPKYNMWIPKTNVV
ncbi:MAG: DDE-type integrase/transposase/recombinase [Gammaproteobacteria bacterium]|nr:MAG: DDE-type integrase/transposase/recombinase [Gammaproteobacteria bacterium]